MPRYFFHIYEYEMLTRPDPEGVELPQLQAAKEECLRVIQETLQEPQSRPELVEGREFRVADESGQTLLIVPFSKSSTASRRPSAVDEHVGRKIRSRRKELRLSQTNLGSMVGISFQQIQKYEKGVNRVGASRLAEIARILEVSVRYFFPDGYNDLPEALNAAGRIADIEARLVAITNELGQLRRLL
jgi:transcriptional regulator with XRE-family HTH domain